MIAQANTGDEAIRISGQDFRITDGFRDAVATCHNIAHTLKNTDIAYGCGAITTAGSNLVDAARFGHSVLDAKAQERRELNPADQAALYTLHKAEITGNKIKQLGRWLTERYVPVDPKAVLKPDPITDPELSVVRGALDDLQVTLTEGQKAVKDTYELLGSNPTLRAAVTAYGKREEAPPVDGFTIPREFTSQSNYRPGVDIYDLARTFAEEGKFPAQELRSHGLGNLLSSLQQTPGAMPEKVPHL